MRVRGSCKELKNQGFYCCGMWQHQGSAKRMVFSHQSLTSCTPPRHFLLYLYLLHVCGFVCSHIPNQSNQYLLFCTGLRCMVFNNPTTRPNRCTAHKDHGCFT
ncbi:hypothetical protein BDV39DRAFT_68624 [Aspergillus sergii]|uniref:Uncharacterized protein n=1 Tax=Aspergillus sergii TaxID=1034303 RepID=A0A5N6X9H8_9EURO|nr:hypothetical protein BDV39DRAFT_68624 [Aspergillus sergii]